MAAGVRSHRAIVALGGFAWQVALRLAGASGTIAAEIGHGVVTELGAGAATGLLPPEPAEYVHR